MNDIEKWNINKLKIYNWKMKMIIIKMMKWKMKVIIIEIMK